MVEGELTKRPHHHAIIYGINFDEDRKEMQVSKTGHIQYYSQTLEEIWACGRTSIQDCLPNNIMYISQYTIKKYKNQETQKKYKPKMTFSNRCKINVKWARRNPKEITKGYLIDNDGHKFKIPRSYTDNFKKEKEDTIYWKCFSEWEDNMLEYFDSHSNTDIIERQKRKAEIRKMREKNFNKKRDF